jgi:hypothetical protein
MNNMQRISIYMSWQAACKGIFKSYLALSHKDSVRAHKLLQLLPNPRLTAPQSCQLLRTY